VTRSAPRYVLGAVASLVLLAVALTAVTYPRQSWAYLTHWTGSPRTTRPYVQAGGDALLRLAVVGDVGDSGHRLDATASAIAALAGDRGFDALAVLGDNSYPVGDPSRLDETIFEPFGPVLDHGTTLLAILGNHDVMDGNAAGQVAALGMPARWWAAERAGTLLVGLDSNQVADPDQAAWLESTLRSSSARWKVVFVHHPPYSAGYQGSNQRVRAVFAPIFERGGVNLVLSGHDHDYQRSKPQNGVVYVVSGAAAGSRRTSSRDFTAMSFSWHHFVELTVYEDRLVGKAVNQDGRVADEWTLR
jgi:3',5'-cyclic AMP phosphodiesterase CpdA